MHILNAIQNAKTLYEHVYFASLSGSKDLLLQQSVLLDINFYAAAQSILSNHAKCQQVYTLFANERSRELYLRELTWIVLTKLVGLEAATNLYPVYPRDMWDVSLKVAEKLLGNLPELHYPADERATLLRALAESFVTESYRYEDIVGIEEGDVFLDCGAYLLETSLWALSKGAATCYAFEPNQHFLPYLRQTREVHERKNDLHVLPLGTSRETGSAKFMPDAASSRISESGKESIQVCSIDDFCQSQQVTPTFIKMDIEGAEPASLEGAAQVIRNHKPKLAICLYHDVAHMWEIPLYIKSLVPEYTFYCKKNSLYYDFVLYATADQGAPHE